MKQKLYLNLPKYKIFDFHRHISNLSEFEQNLNDFNIAKFCLMPTTIKNDFENIPNYIENVKPYYEKYKDKSLIFGAIDFSNDYTYNKELLEKQKKTVNIRGIKFHPEQGFNLDTKFLKPYFRAISEILGFDNPIYIHTDWPLKEEQRYVPESRKNTFDKIVSSFSDFQFIMGHAGGSGAYLNVWKSCKKFSNVYLETSMSPVTSPLEEVIWKIGPERLLFGSNYPYCATSIELVKLQSLYKISDEDVRMILESNAEVLFSK
ncbi:MAG: amidohydrolase family protein [Promethearchaeota archaeon]